MNDAQLPQRCGCGAVPSAAAVVSRSCTVQPVTRGWPSSGRPPPCPHTVRQLTLASSVRRGSGLAHRGHSTSQGIFSEASLTDCTHKGASARLLSRGTGACGAWDIGVGCCWSRASAVRLQQGRPAAWPASGARQRSSHGGTGQASRQVQTPLSTCCDVSRTAGGLAEGAAQRQEAVSAACDDSLEPLRSLRVWPREWCYKIK